MKIFERVRKWIKNNNENKKKKKKKVKIKRKKEMKIRIKRKWMEMREMSGAEDIQLAT